MTTVAPKRWKFSEEKVLIDNYSEKTIKELMDLLPNRDENAINCKIKRLKKQNRIASNKTEDAVNRSYQQRSRK